jgi:hypothetical protein
MPDWLFYLIVVVVVWLLMGLSAAAASVYMEWREGNDLTVDDLPHVFVVIGSGLVGLIMFAIYALQEWIKHKRDGVVLRGSASAKAYRELSKP